MAGFPKRRGFEGVKFEFSDLRPVSWNGDREFCLKPNQPFWFLAWRFLPNSEQQVPASPFWFWVGLKKQIGRLAGRPVCTQFKFYVGSKLFVGILVLQRVVVSLPLFVFPSVSGFHMSGLGKLSLSGPIHIDDLLFCRTATRGEEKEEQYWK